MTTGKMGIQGNSLIFMQTTMKNALNALIVSSAVLVMGCQSTRQSSAPLLVTEPVPVVGSQNQPQPESSVRYDTQDARIAKIWLEAEQARRGGNSDLALQRLFEGIDIQPQNSLLWSRAAEIQLNNEQAALAENFAAKSNTFAGNNDSLLHRNWLIIEHARSMRGDLLGVRSAHKKVQEYQYR